MIQTYQKSFTDLLRTNLKKDSILTIRLNILLFVLVGYLLNACSIQPITTSVPEHKIPLPKSLSSSESPRASPKYWWSVRFKMVWSGDVDAICFANELIIAHQIVNPVLEGHYDDIKLWRFHRRAANDSAGHQFSFIFYATPGNAREIFQQIKQNPLSQRLINEAIVKQIRMDNPDKPKRPNIEDTSDKSWSVAVQKSWPYYIMGVSILWLDLLNQEAIREQLDTSNTIQSQLQQYKRISEQITQHWKSHGKHAFFHHINGIFAYEPLEVRF